MLIAVVIKGFSIAGVYYAPGSQITDPVAVAQIQGNPAYLINVSITAVPAGSAPTLTGNTSPVPITSIAPATVANAVIGVNATDFMTPIATAAAIAAIAPGAAPVTAVNGKIGAVSLGASDVGALQAAGGDASATTARPAGAPLARALSAILADFPNVASFGVSGNGSDQTAALQAAITALSNGGLLRVAAGNLVTNGTVTNTEVGYEFDSPTIGGGYIPGIMDQAAACRALKVLAGVLGPRYDHILHISGISEPTGIAASNERTLAYLHGQQNEPSDYTVNPPYLRDLALVELSNTIPTGNMAGRIWTLNNTLIVQPGGDGYVVGIEGGIVNNGAYQPAYGTPNAKIFAHALASGPQDSTAAFVAASSGGCWRFGLYSYVAALRSDGYLWALDTGVSFLAYCDPTGSIRADTLEVTHGKVTLGSGQAGLQAGKVVMRGVSTGGNAVRLTMDGNPATAANSLTIGDYSAFNVSIQLVARDASSGSSHVAWTLPVGLLKRVSGAASTTWFGGTPATVNDGGPNTSGFTVTVSADTTLGALSLTFAPPGGNTDQWDVIATVMTTEGQ